MSNNFEWQKHQAQEKIHGRLHEAAVHRMVKQAAPKRENPLPHLLRVFIRLPLQALKTNIHLDLRQRLSKKIDLVRDLRADGQFQK